MSKVKVKIDHDRDGWHYYNDCLKSIPIETYPKAIRLAIADGYEVDNAGWLHLLLSWNFHNHVLDGYPEWEIEGRNPAFVKLSHKREFGAGVESHQLAVEWDDIATVDFYQRDWTSDGIPFVQDGETYWSGWWFATIDERDRFLSWVSKRATVVYS